MYKFKSRWSEDVSIGWCKTNRVEFNKIIDAYNNWQIEDNFDKEKAQIVLAKIEYGKQTIGSFDGGYYRKNLLRWNNLFSNGQFSIVYNYFNKKFYQS